jgi:anaerobic magnesium-protoporphyrin IX monomethyl ester cyclase
MRVALINPNWSFDHSIYFGCREPHLPLEFGYSRALLEARGHDVDLVDGHSDRLTITDIRQRVHTFGADVMVITTAPSYLFWRCAPPELRVPRELCRSLAQIPGTKVIIGPHVSTTPRAALKKLSADAGILGEPEEILPALVEARPHEWSRIPSICYWQRGEVTVQGAPHQSRMKELPALSWTAERLRNHAHHHHRFETAAEGPGAEMEVSRGCPYHCSFCAKDNFRTDYRKRPVEIVLQELDGLLKCGARYIYFIDEIFLPDRELLCGLAERSIQFGIQTRIDLWTPEMLELLGKAGCVSIEAGVESISAEGRDLLDKKCRLSTDELCDRLIKARAHVPFVQANLIECNIDDANDIEQWRERLIASGVWANRPVPLFPYPGSPDYTRLWGVPDDVAWERASAYYLDAFSRFSDIQEEFPLPLPELEKTA